jgi:hypothetical protein
VEDDDEMPELEEVSDSDNDDEEETRLAAEEFDRNQAFADTDRDVSHLRY